MPRTVIGAAPAFFIVRVAGADFPIMTSPKARLPLRTRLPAGLGVVTEGDAGEEGGEGDSPPQAASVNAAKAKKARIRKQAFMDAS
jgi:hypothetical protein